MAADFDDNYNDSIPTYVDATGDDLRDHGEEEVQLTHEQLEAMSVANATKTLDLIQDALYDEHLDDLSSENAALVTLHLSAKLMGRALATLVMISRKPEGAAKLLSRGLEKGVSSVIPSEAVVTRSGRMKLDFVRDVTDRFIETAAQACRTAVRSVPGGTSNGD